MEKISNFKHRFFSAFRELFVHHHGSLEFRAKILALMVASFEDESDENQKVYEIIKDYGLKLYDENRANLLLLTTKELVQKVYDDNGLDIDTLITNIQKELKIIPRYAKKIDLEALQPFLLLTKDKDTISYQENIIDFLQNLKNETLKTKEEEIKEYEDSITLKSNTK